MAPITEDTVEQLKSMVHRLESRVQELEQKIQGGEGASGNPLSAMRMVIMGPPGAGAPCNKQSNRMDWRLTASNRQGYSSSED